MNKPMFLDLGPDLTIPVDAVAETFAIMGIRGAGKTNTAKRMAEEMCRKGLPWIALDPVGVWWGLRANKDGTPSDLPVVVFGGKHGDLPLERKAGKAMARAIVRENVCAVIDMKGESKTFWRTFLVDFCLELMELDPESPRHVFIEEAPEFCPQRGNTDQTRRTTEAVERLVRLGRNQGYGATLVTQRPARVSKDVLSQCENLIVMRTTGKHDRQALAGWLEAHDREDYKFKGLGQLKSGEAYFWSPQWLEMFQRVKIWESDTFHPGRTRRVGQQAQQAELGDVSRFVSNLVVELAREEGAQETDKAKRKSAAPTYPKSNADQKVVELEQRVERMRNDLRQLRDDNNRVKQESAALRKQLDRVRQVLKPFADAYAEVVDAGAVAGPVDTSAWEPWLDKAGGPRSSRRRMLEIMIEKRELTRRQLCTLAGVNPTSGSTYNAISWLKTNQLIQRDGDRITLQDVA
jgi:hypothetical protein